MEVKTARILCLKESVLLGMANSCRMFYAGVFGFVIFGTTK